MADSDVPGLPSSPLAPSAVDWQSDEIPFWDTTAGEMRSLRMGDMAGMRVVNVKRYGAAGDGDASPPSDDTTEIQSAFTAATAGDVIYFPPGVYLISSGITKSDTDGLTIFGPGATILRDTGSGDYGMVDLTRCDNLRILHITIDGQRSIDAIGASPVVDPKADALAIRGCVNVELTGCVFKDCRYALSVLGDAASPEVISQNVSVHHNRGTTPAAHTKANFSANALPDLFVNAGNGGVDGLEISGNVMEGYRLVLASNGTDGVTVSGNNCKYPSDSCIYVEGLSDFVISNNFIFKPGKDCAKVLANGAVSPMIESKRGTISGNVFSCGGEYVSNSYYALQIQNSSNVSVTGNTLYAFSGPTNGQTQRLLLLRACSDITVTGNTLVNEDLSTDQVHGITVENAGIDGNDDVSRMIIANNVIRDMTGRGITFSNNVSGYLYEDVSITDNLITGNDATRYMNYGIAIACNNGTLQRFHITGNVIRSCFDGAIYIGGNSQFTDIFCVNNHSYNNQAANRPLFYFAGWSGLSLSPPKTPDRIVCTNNFTHDNGDLFRWITASDNEYVIAYDNWDNNELVDLVVAKTSGPVTLAATDTGKTFSNEGTSTTFEFDLPAAVLGMRFKFVMRDASSPLNALRIDPNGSQAIGDAAGGKYLELASYNAMVELRCYVAGSWVIEKSTGTLNVEP